MAKKRNIIVGQSGGPTAVINSSLAGVYKNAIERGFDKVYGMLHGIQRKTGSGNLSPYSVRESCESDGYYSCSNADTEELLWNLSEDHRNGEGQRGSPGDGAKSDR